MSEMLLSCRSCGRTSYLSYRSAVKHYLSSTRHARIHHAATKCSGPGPRVAIIGSGPAGFYTAQKMMREIEGTKVDMYEQLPVPFGLVRFGVAPDHPEVKVRDEASERRSY